MKDTKEIVICDTCRGSGSIKEGGDETSFKVFKCVACNGGGRLIKHIKYTAYNSIKERI